MKCGKDFYLFKENTTISFGGKIVIISYKFSKFPYLFARIKSLFFCYVVWEYVYVMLLFKLLFLLQHSEKKCVGSGSDLNPRS